MRNQAVFKTINKQGLKQGKDTFRKKDLLKIMDVNLKTFRNGSSLRCSMVRFVCWAAGSLAGLTAFAATNKGVDVNDVSILFPEPISEQELGKMLKADTLLKSGQAILPDAILQDILKYAVLGRNEAAPNVGLLDENGVVVKQIALPGAGLENVLGAGAEVKLTDRSRWAVVSLRFDYGFPGDFVPESQRKVQLRLILQPVANLNNSGFAADAAIHLLFDFARGDSPEKYANAKRLIAATILRIKEEAERSGISTTGKGLSVHPVMKAQGLGGAFNATVSKEVLQLLEMGELTSIATMISSSRALFGEWFFFSGIVNQGVYQPLAQTFNKTSSLFESFLEEDQVVKTSGAASPEFKDSRPQTNDFLNDPLKRDPSFELPISPKGIVSMGLIQDPHFGGLLPNRPNALNHLSCTTCHAATARQVFLKEKDIVVPQLKGLTPDNKPTNFIAQGNVIDSRDRGHIRNFGYFFREPSIALRTLNESVLVAAETNRILNLHVQGKQCLNLPRYISCLGTQLGASPSQQTCFVDSCQ